MMRPALAILAFVMAVSVIVTVVAAQNIFGTVAISATANIVVPPGGEDVDGDGCVSDKDFALVAGSFGLAAPLAEAADPADVNGDGVVDVVDLTLVGLAFGTRTFGSGPCS